MLERLEWGGGGMDSQPSKSLTTSFLRHFFHKNFVFAQF